RPVAELAVGAGAPAVHGAVLRDRTGVLPAGVDRGEVQLGLDLGRIHVPRLVGPALHVDVPPPAPCAPLGRERAGVTVARRDLLEELGRVDQRGHVAILRRPAVAELATLACAPAEGLSLRRDRARVLDAGIQRDVVAECATRAERIVAGGKRQQCQQGLYAHASLHVILALQTCSLIAISRSSGTARDTG